MNGFMEANMDVLHAFAQLRSGPLTAIMSFLTMMGQELVVILVLCLLYWCINKKVAFGVGIAFFVSSNLVEGTKIIARIPRPWNLGPSFIAVEHAKADVLNSYSFPSGHTQSATALFGTLGFAYKKRNLQIVCFALVLLVGITRMYLGVHTPLDVVTSWIFTLILAWLSAKFLCCDNASDRNRIGLLVTLILSVILLILAYSLSASGTIQETMATGSYKQAGSALGFAVGVFIEQTYIKFDTKTRHIKFQIIKFMCGLAGILIIKELMRPLFRLIAGHYVGDALRYFCIVLWVAALFPLLIKKAASRRQ